MLRVRLFGPVSYLVDGSEEIRLTDLRFPRILAYLAIHANAHATKAAVRSAVWGRVGAEDNLRRALRALRDQHPRLAAHLCEQGRTIGLEPASLEIDVLTFADLKRAERYDDAIRHVRGGFMADVPDALSAWVDTERRRWNGQAARVCELLAARDWHDGRRESSIEFARRRERLRPDDQEAVIALAAYLAASGELEEAVDKLHVFRSTHRALAQEPSQALDHAIARLSSEEPLEFPERSILATCISPSRVAPAELMLTTTIRDRGREPVPDEGKRRDRSVIDAQERYRALDVDHFAGRSWLLEELDRFFAANDSGYFVLEGAAGIGKSTFLAWLAQTRDYALHFVRLAGERDDTSAALSNLAAQVATAWDIERPASLLGNDARPSEFDAFLCDVARTRKQRRRRKPIVLVIDGLDEVRAGALDHGNVLGLPERPPDGVYFIVSQRPVPVALTVQPLWLCRLQLGDERHLADLREYLHAATQGPALAAALQDAGVAARAFVAQLTAKSGGVWLYVRHVLDEIERGRRDVGNLEDLPPGLWAYYAQQCARTRGRRRERWERCDLPVLGTLAAAQEPLTQATLADLAGVPDATTIDDVLNDWSPFLERDGEQPYRLYHDSLRRFLSGDASQDLRVRERRIAERLARATTDAHHRIIDHYLRQWGGLREGLPRLRDPQRATTDAGYGVRHFVAHLQAAARDEELPALLMAEWPSESQPLNAWYEAHAQAGDHARYLTDVARALQVARTATDRALQGGQLAVTAGDEYGYALLAGSIRSHSACVPPELRTALVRHGVWSSARALADARALTDPGKRARALGALAPALAGAASAHACEESLAAASHVANEYSRSDVFVELAADLSSDHVTEMFQAARHFTSDHARGRVWACLAMRLSDDDVCDALRASDRIVDEYSRAYVLRALIPRLDAGQVSQVLKATSQFTQEYARANVLVPLAPRLNADQVSGVVKAAEQFDGEHARTRVLAALAARLSEDQISAMLDATGQFSSAFARATMLAALAEHVPTPRGYDVVSDALAAARAIADEFRRVEAMAALAGQLTDDQVSEELLAARKFTDEFWRANAVVALAARLDDEQVADELAAARRFKNSNTYGVVLKALAARLGRDQITREVHFARQLADNGSRAHALSALAPGLDPDQLGEILDAARDIAEYARGEVLGAIAGRLGRNEACKALDVARRCGDALARADALGALAHLLDDGQVIETLHASYELRDEYAGARVVAALAQHLTDDQVSDALRTCQRFANEPARGVVFAALAGRLTDAQIKKVLPSARAFTNQRWRARVLESMLARLSTDQIGEELQDALRIPNESVRADMLTVLAEHVDGVRVSDVLDSVRDNASEWERGHLLAALGARLNDEEVRHALEVARQFGDESARAEALVGLAARLNGDEVSIVLEGAREMTGEWRRARVLVALADQLDADLRDQVLAEALETLQQMGLPMLRVGVLKERAMRLDDAQISAELSAAEHIVDETMRADVLLGLAERLSDAQMNDALLQALSLVSRKDRVRAVGGLLLRQGRPPALRDRAWRDVLDTAASLGRREVLESASSAAPIVYGIGGPEAIQRMLDWIRAVGRWWP